MTKEEMSDRIMKNRAKQKYLYHDKIKNIRIIVPLQQDLFMLADRDNFLPMIIFVVLVCEGCSYSPDYPGRGV